MTAHGDDTAKDGTGTSATRLISRQSTAGLVKRTDGALALLQAVVDESSAAFWYEKGMRLAWQEWPEAIYALMQCTEREPTHWRALIDLARGLAEIGKPIPAAQALQQAFDSNYPGWYEFAGRLPANEWFVLRSALESKKTGTLEGYTLLYGLTLVFRALEQNEQALHTLDVMQSLYKFQVRQTAQWYFLSGCIHSDAKLWEESVTAFDQAIVLNPKSAAAYHYRGYAKANQHLYKEAMINYNKAIELDPDHTLAYRHWGYEKVANQDCPWLTDLELDLDIASWDQQIEQNPHDAHPYLMRGYAQVEKQNNAWAIADFDQCIALDPKDGFAYLYRGIAKANQQSYADAIDDFNQAIILAPNRSFAYHNRALVKEQLGDSDGAAADWQRLSELESPSK